MKILCQVLSQCWGSQPSPSSNKFINKVAPYRGHEIAVSSRNVKEIREFSNLLKKNGIWKNNLETNHLKNIKDKFTLPRASYSQKNQQPKTGQSFFHRQPLNQTTPSSHTILKTLRMVNVEKSQPKKMSRSYSAPALLNTK